MMFKKLGAIFGGGRADPPPASVPLEEPRVSAYAEPAANRIYNMLFCDQPGLFRPQPGAVRTAWQATLFAAQPQRERVLALANDGKAEPRVRLLACGWLKAAGIELDERVLLGVVVEVPVGAGLDTLAAYADGGVRYINHAGGMSIVEGIAQRMKEPLQDLFSTSMALVPRLPPATEPRVAPPPEGGMRITFLTSFGPYVAESTFAFMMRDATSGPVVAAAVDLLQAVIAFTASPRTTQPTLFQGRDASGGVETA